MTFEKWWSKTGRYFSARGVKMISKDAWDTAAQAERERCAKIAEDVGSVNMADAWFDRAVMIKDKILGDSND